MATTFTNLPSSRPSDLVVTTGLQSPPSTDLVFLKTFEADHLSGNRFYTGDWYKEFEPLMQRIESPEVTGGFRHAQQDFNGNGFFAPKSAIDAAALRA